MDEFDQNQGKQETAEDHDWHCVFLAVVWKQFDVS